MASVSRNHEENSTFYLPLDDKNNEIRVLKILPLQPDQPIHCTIEIVSLDHHSAAYHQFITPSNWKNVPARRVAQEWIKSRPSPQPLPGDVPNDEFHRFTWGDFAALSYVWGDKKSQKSILLNGAVFSVTENLYRALRVMAEQNEFQNSKYRIWIDALCINQKDDEERASQVRKMRDIYSTAWTVFSWVANPRDRVDGAYIPEAFAFLRILAFASNPKTKQTLSTLFAHRLRILTEYLVSLHKLTTQKYWERLWIIQEVVMGASSTVLRCGEHTLDWDTFAKGIAFMYLGDNWSLKDEYLLDSNGRPIGWVTESIHLIHQDLSVLIRAERDSGENPGMRRLLETAGSADCLEVRDKVFALVGLMDPGIAERLHDAYGLPIHLLFAEATKSFIFHYNNLESLRHANLWGNFGAPTWAVDWTYRGRVRWSRVETVLTGPTSSQQDSKPERVYNAHLGMPANYRFISGGRNMLLSCSGFIVDEIVGLGAPENGYFKWFKNKLVECPFWNSSYGDDEATARALYRTLLADTISGGQKAREQHISAVRHLPTWFEEARPQFVNRGWTWLANQEGYYYKWTQWRRAHEDFMVGKRTLGSFFNHEIPPEADESTFVDAYMSVKRTVMERRFILTKGGRFGWAPDNMYLFPSTKLGRTEPEPEVVVGDKIAIIFGCSTPIIIRPTRENFHYEVVGEGYVEGMMYGEAVKMLRNGMYQEQVLRFC
ncbi:heterokaryon incompatibility protein-domain-containing protein [Podospora fimiseda]|uniref:Heterokaryon incompatibility protein-domain-containing protein n=1 Tax=Podospora fimiseda TaxID=252190 RepID=A0AAN7BIU1_9PEZI|nr:heterokaryon incompatibility protein-domain-containing protein [Podospora fimiseda]